MNNDYNNGNNNEQPSVDESLKNSGQNVYNKGKNIYNQGQELNDIRNRIKASKEKSKLGSKDVSNESGPNSSLEKKDGLEEKKKGLTKKSSGKAVGETGKELGKEGTKKAAKEGTKKVAKEGAKKVAEETGKAVAKKTVTSVLRRGIWHFLLFTPPGWIILGVIVVIILIVFLILFIKFSVLEPFSSRYNVSPDDMVGKYDQKINNFEDNETMDKIFADETNATEELEEENANIFSSFMGWLQKTFKPTDKQKFNKLISKSIDKVKKTINTKTNNVTIAPGLIISTLVELYTDNSPHYEGDDLRENDIEDVMDMLYDIINKENINVYDSMMFNYMNQKYNKYIEIPVEGGYTCELEEINTYLLDDTRYKLFLLFGETIANRYQEYKNIELESKSGTEKCFSPVIFTDDMKDFLEKADKIIEEKDSEFNEDFNYQNGFIYTHYERFQNTGYSFDSKKTPKEIKNIMTDIFLRENEMNEVLGYKTAPSGYDGQNYVNMDGTSLPLGSFSTGGRDFGMHLHPIHNDMRMHYGIDLTATEGCNSPIYSFADGTVVLSTFNSGAGNYIIIDHGLKDDKNISTTYMHMVELSPLKVGDTVKAGQVIGKEGTTGGSTGCHLHFQVNINSIAVDPCPYILKTVGKDINNNCRYSSF
ncbi:MAG: peptidoglycan DD-metalloendopeptidase family protein [Bacilli bacterium]